MEHIRRAEFWVILSRLRFAVAFMPERFLAAAAVFSPAGVSILIGEFIELHGLGFVVAVVVVGMEAGVVLRHRLAGLTLEG